MPAKVDGRDNGQAIADAIFTTVKFLQNQQSNRIRQHVISARLYGNAQLVGVAGLTAASMASQTGTMKERITDNVVQSVVDTATARIGENKPRPYFLTSGGNYKSQRKAKKWNQLVEGIFYENRAYDLGGESQRDGEIFGDGLIYVCDLHGRVTFQRVMSAELWVDEAEAVYGCPREMHWVRAVDREALAGAFPDAKKKIHDAPRAPLGDYGYSQNRADLVLVRESWHLRSSPDAKDGKHCISIDGQLIDPVTEWEHDFFPFARFQWSPRPMGYWSQGLAEQLMNKQLEINKLLWLIQRSFHMAATYKVLIEDGSKIVSEHINNQIGAIIKYRGTKPEWMIPNVVPPEYYQHLQTLIMSCYERAGISLQSATGQKPAGLNSGEAQRVYRDTVAERLKTQERYNERGYLDLARIAIAIAKDIATREGSYGVKTPKGQKLAAVKMTRAELEDDDWTVQCFPTSSLPRDPAGRLQTIQEYIQAGFMTPRQGRRALDFPDLEAVESLANAEEDLLTEILDRICDDGDYAPPEPTDNLQLCKELVVEYINRGRMLNLDDERLDMLRQWSIQVDALMQAAMPPAPPPGMMPPGPGGAQAVAAPPPVSNLLPNVPGAPA